MRSKSVINPPDERALGGLLLLPGDPTQPQSSYQHHRHNQSTYPLRRQSAITDIKAKVSKWTKVKAAFKWERANPSLNGTVDTVGKSTDSGIGLLPLNTEVARYLRVPSLPIACTGASSADSMLSASSSGHLLLSGSASGGAGGGCSGSSIPASPGTMSSASSMDDVLTAPEDFREYTPLHHLCSASIQHSTSVRSHSFHLSVFCLLFFRLMYSCVCICISALARALSCPYHRMYLCFCSRCFVFSHPILEKVRSVGQISL